MLDSYFLPYQQVLIVIAFFFYFISVVFFEFSKKQTLAILFLLTGTLLFKLFVISADEFINLWDEQFHALVAKNLSKDFFFPKLYPDPILPYNYKSWTDNYVWVHKQPFFLMQMAVFIKLFGCTAFVVRLPSVLCFTFAVFCIYKIGENTLTKRIGFIGALFFSMNYFLSEMIVGGQPTDHNDVIFICYIIASVWAYTEYLKNKESFKWLFLIALFCSFAVLTKWLPGYLVFGIWLVVLIQQKGFIKNNRKDWIDMFKTLGMALILPLIGQVYIYCRFPLEAENEHDFNVRHISEPLEGHGGDSFYHLDNIAITIGYYAPFFILLGITLLYKYTRDKKVYAGFLFALIVVFLFFTFVATKMPAFTFIVYFIIFLGFGSIFENLYGYLKLGSNVVKKCLFSGLLIYCAFSFCNLEGLQKNHTRWVKKEFGLQNFRNHNVEWLKTCEQIKKELKDEKYVIFNCDPIDFIKLMFYTDYIGYSIIPNPFEINLAKIKGYKIAIIDNGKLPSYISARNDIRRIKNLQDRVVTVDTVIMKIGEKQFLNISAEGKLSINPENASKIILSTFADGRSQLKGMNGKIATSRVNEGGLVVFEKDVYEIYEQFLIISDKGKYTIRTIFDEDLVVPKGETNFYTKRHQDKKLEVEFLKNK